MICEKRDSDLLLLARGELGFFSRTRTGLHVRQCARCRRRMGELGGVSAAFALALGPNAGERPTGANPRPPSGSLPVSVSHVAIVALMVIIGISLFVAVRSVMSSERPALPTSAGLSSSVRHAAIGCRPGLPNDKCR